MFPALASVFGVMVDYLMTGQRKGITFVGNILSDIVKQVDCAPEVGMLVTLNEVLKDAKKITMPSICLIPSTWR